MENLRGSILSAGSKFDSNIRNIVEKLNYISCLALLIMMLITCFDIFLRIFRHTIPGAYELVGYLGALTVSFSLAATSIGRGHIAVEYLVSKFSLKTRQRIEKITFFFSSILFFLISWKTFIFAFDLKSVGEVSMTLQLPVYPITFGVASGCGCAAVVMLFQALNIVKNN